MRLYHYTCGDSAPEIDATGQLRPNYSAVPPVVWLTDLEVPDAAALGLTSRTLGCDRTRHRVEVEPAAALWWPTYARSLPRELRAYLEDVPGVLPAHWWVSEEPVPIVRNSTRTGS